MFFTYKLPFVQQTCFPCTKGPAADIRYRKQVSDVGHARNNRMFPDIRTHGRNLPDTKCRTCYGNPVTLTSLVTATFFKARTKMNLNGLEIGLTKL